MKILSVTISTAPSGGGCILFGVTKNALLVTFVGEIYSTKDFKTFKSNFMWRNNPTPCIDNTIVLYSCDSLYKLVHVSS